MFGIPALFSLLAGLPVIGAIIKIGNAFLEAVLSCKACLIAIMAVVAAVALYAAGWENRNKDYQLLRGEVTSIERKFDCGSRPKGERELSVCIAARERDAETAKAEELEKQRDAAAKAQADLDKATAQLAAQADDFDQFIAEQAKANDGAVPKVLLDTWAKRRALMGVK